MLNNLNPFLLFLLGAVMLYYGSEYLINNSSLLAKKFNVPSILVGITIIALGTSLPEFVVSLEAIHNNYTGLVIGNIVGSNISNICLVLGIIFLFFRYRLINFKNFSRSISFLLFVSIIFFSFIYSTDIFTSKHAFVLLSLLVFYIYVLMKSFSSSQTKSIYIKNNKENVYSDIMKLLLFIILGVFILSFGADIFINGALGIARIWGIEKSIIGLTIIALGTSIPELFVSVNAAIKKEYDFVIGNVIGSNIINIVFVGGISSLISDLTFTRSDFYFSNIILILITFLLPLLLFQKELINRFLGGIFIIIYFIFLYINFTEMFLKT